MSRPIRDAKARAAADAMAAAYAICNGEPGSVPGHYMSDIAATIRPFILSALSTPEFSAPEIPCESCGANCVDSLIPADHKCFGCGRVVCQSCVDVFDHMKDGLHGTGQPHNEVRRLRDSSVEGVRVVRGGLGGPDTLWLWIGHQGFRIVCDPDPKHPHRVDWYEKQLRAAVASLRAAKAQPGATT